MAIVGALALNTLGSEGHAAFNTTNLGLHWGLPIVIYDYFLLTSTGLAMIAALVILFDSEAFRPIVKRAVWLALAGLAGGVVVLMLESAIRCVPCGAFPPASPSSHPSTGRPWPSGSMCSPCWS